MIISRWIFDKQSAHAKKVHTLNPPRAIKAANIRRQSALEILKRLVDEKSLPAKNDGNTTLFAGNIRRATVYYNAPPFLKRRQMKTCLNALIAAIGICTISPPAAGIENNRDLADIQSEIQRIGGDVRTLAAEKNTQLEELKKIEKQYGELTNALFEIKKEIREQEKSLEQVRNKVSTTQANIKTQRHGLEGLIQSAYAIGDQDNLKVFLNQRDPTLSGRMLVYHDYISKARLRKLQSIEDDLKTLRQLESQKDTETQLLQIALDKKQQESDAMQALKKQREKLLIEIDRDYASKKDQLQDLIHDEKKLEALLASFQKTDDNAQHEDSPIAETSPPLKTLSRRIDQNQPQPQGKPIIENRSQTNAFADLQGHLPWPVQGAIIARFGSRRFETSWDGTVISAHEGADIHAVAPGRVVFSDWLRGYGLMLIVDHGKGYMSLYAFNQSLRKSVGEQVRTGEVVASVGRSGGRSEAALYFGIRKKGRPVDPEQWCKKQANG